MIKWWLALTSIISCTLLRLTRKMLLSFQWRLWIASRSLCSRPEIFRKAESGRTISVRASDTPRGIFARKWYPKTYPTSPGNSTTLARHSYLTKPTLETSFCLGATKLWQPWLELSLTPILIMLLSCLDFLSSLRSCSIWKQSPMGYRLNGGQTWGTWSVQTSTTLSWSTDMSILTELKCSARWRSF